MRQNEIGTSRVARDIAQLAHEIGTTPSAGKVVLCHGCFDPLHYGHLLHFREAKTFGSMLVVTITADMFVNKGGGRPIFTAEQRADLVGALRIVDRVGISESETAAAVLEVVRPAIFAKGLDYVDSRSPLLRAELAVAKRLGIEIRYTGSVKFSATEMCVQAGWLDRRR
ncbi:adenylyltransferase/cytidyltransferase family protein [Cupriavidus sp. RAF12]|uniref:adenylyltransferase/cytidyltransferase family protein n=1 Tax=Cupriavidus sp. RAF12 TaxID=3233050 RepID=UPI003F8E2D76